jgi:PAS domain S-box-containing protein
MNTKSLRLLLAEDSDADAFLVVKELQRFGFQVESTRVQSSSEFRSELVGGKFDIILCDHFMPDLDALAALKILHESGRDIPLIVVSGAISEKVAVEVMRNGASDYLLKDNLTRLGAAVERELRDAETRRQKRLLDSFSQGQMTVLAMILNGEPLTKILERIIERVEILSANDVRCSIMLVDPEGSHLVLGAAPGLPLEFLEDIRVVPIRPGIGSCGSAAALGRNIIVEDISVHPDWKDVRKLTKKFGLRACWAVPVFSADRRVLGTMSVYHRMPHSPTEEELHWVESASRLVSLAIERSQSVMEKKQAEANTERLAARLTTTLESITDAFFTVDRDWRFTYVNRQAEQILLRDGGELLGKVMWEEFPEFENSPFGRGYRQAVSENHSIEMVEFHAARGWWLEVRAYPSPEGLAVYMCDVTEQRQGQEQLMFLENCVSRINDIVLITGAGSPGSGGQKVLFVNDAFIRHTGYSREEVLGKAPRFLLGPKSQFERVAEIRAALEHNRPARAELIIYKKSGDEIWLEVDIVPVTEPQGVVSHMVAVAREITRRKAAEEVARASEARYLMQRNALITLTRDASSEGLDLQGAFQRITETTARTLDVTRVGIWRYTDDMEHIDCLDLFHLESAEHHAGAALEKSRYPAYFKGADQTELLANDEAASGPRTFNFTGGDPSPEGIVSLMDVPVHYGSSVHYFLCTEHVGSPREWTADEKTFAVAIANQISLALESFERARAEEEVLRSHQRFQSVAAATNDTIWDWDLLTDAFWWNDGFAKLFGWSSTEVDSTIHAWIRQIHPEDRNRVVREVYAAIDRGDALWTDEYRFISNDGAISDVIDRAQIIRDANGKAIRMVGGMTDLTAQKAAADELARSHRALQMLSACNEMLVRTSDENDLLAEACRIAVEVGGYRMAWVGYALDDEKRRISPMAFAGEELGYLSEVDISWAEDRPSGEGPAGQAVRTGNPVVFEDVMGNQGFSYWQAPARARGYRSVVCLPLHDGNRSFGVICLYTAQPNPTSAEELKMLGDMAGDLVFGIENCRGRLERQRTLEVVIKVAKAVSSGTGTEFFDLLAQNLVESMGAFGGLVGRYNLTDRSIDTLSYVVGGETMENLKYSLEGTPCGQVIGEGIQVYERDVQQAFPEDHFLVELGVAAYAGIPLLHRNGEVAGIMAVFFSQPLDDSSLVRSTLQIFATRAAAELDRQQADARIREQASLLDKAQDAIVVRDLNHHITYWNKSAERLYGWSAAEVMGRSVGKLLYRDPKAFAKAHKHTLRTGEWVGEMNQVDKYGRDLIIEGRWTLVRDDKGKPESVFVINTDISEHRKLEQQFLQAQRLESIGTLAGGIAHDLNNILAPISMAIELLRMRFDDDRSAELLDTISSSAKRGADMVGQVLSFARGMEGRRVEVHPRQLISEIEGILRDTLLKNIGMEIRASRDLWAIHGDPTQLHQVLLNLCVNAADAVAGGGQIFITADNIHIDPTFAAMNLEAKEGPHVCIEVRDTGEGIPPEIIGKIFDPFFTTKSVGKGTGLGLSTSLAIVKSHGGFIRATSEPGHGARFKVYLPADPEMAAATAVQIRPELPKGNGEMVLVVDDEQSIRQITRETLEAFGYHTLLAADGHEAVSLYASRLSEIDVVLTDMMMPVMDGPATIRLLMEINPAVKIIAASGITANREIAHKAGAGVRNFLTKPYTAETLLKCIKQTLAQ